MPEISKHLFDSTCRDAPCSILMHPGDTSCIGGTWTSLKMSIPGSLKFYSIVYLAQIAIRGKKMKSKAEWIKMGEYYLRSSLLGCYVATSACAYGCVLNKLLGNKFSYYTYIFLPNFINAFAVYLEPPGRRSLVINLFCNLVIEYWIRMSERAGVLRMTKSKQALLFMFGSSLLFYLMRLEGDKKSRTSLFWLFTPEKVNHSTEKTGNVCPHKGPCLKHISRGFLTLFGVGFAFTFVRHLMSTIKRPISAFTTLRPKHFKMAMFFGGYIGIYRAVICYLCRKRGYDAAEYALPAGFLAGLSFAFNPNLGIAIAAMTGAIKLFTTILYERKMLTEKVPLPELLFAFCQGTLYHARFMHPDVCPKYVYNLMGTVTSGRTEELIAKMMETIKFAS